MNSNYRYEQKITADKCQPSNGRFVLSLPTEDTFKGIFFAFCLIPGVSPDNKLALFRVMYYEATNHYLNPWCPCLLMVPLCINVLGTNIFRKLWQSEYMSDVSML